GFKLVGPTSSSYSAFGISVASAGDVNGDGYADIIVGAPGPSASSSDHSGTSYVIFGKASGFGASLDVTHLDGSNGFSLTGEPANASFAPDNTGVSVSSAGDINGDGFSDLIIGAPNAEPSSTDANSWMNDYGASYVVFGKAPDTAVTLDGTDASQ